MLLLASLAPQGRAAGLAARALGRLGKVGRDIIRMARGRRQENPPPRPQTEKPNIFERPKGVPKEWKAKPTKSGEGREYQHPTDKGTYVKVEKGNPNSSNPGQRYDNVRVQKNGKSYDKYGNEVPRKSQESHIPLEEFNAEIFKL